MSEFITDEYVLDNISEDMSYIKEMIKREKDIDLPLLKHAHLARLVIVFSYNSIEAYRDFISHGLVDCSAIKFQEKIKRITNADMRKKPNKFSFDDVEKFLKFYDEMVNFMGMSRALLSSSQK